LRPYLYNPIFLDCPNEPILTFYKLSNNPEITYEVISIISSDE